MYIHIFNINVALLFLYMFNMFNVYKMEIE